MKTRKKGTRNGKQKSSKWEKCKRERNGLEMKNKAEKKKIKKMERRKRRELESKIEMENGTEKGTNRK
ncbi:MAG: hypothetical protein NT157_05145 [Candidatus Micrarchaeota archaeon]|nr:hypothetical protein [Candidatus Micrarchaeota archaeon]